MDERIIAFMQAQKAASLCCVDEEGKPYCFSCFYAFDVQHQTFYFKTNAQTHHAAVMQKRFDVAGTIMPDKLNPLAIKGIQFKGYVIQTEEAASAFYHKKYPFSLAMRGEVWVIKLTYLKMTDNTMSIGKKIIWETKRDDINEIVK